MVSWQVGGKKSWRAVGFPCVQAEATDYMGLPVADTLAFGEINFWPWMSALGALGDLFHSVQIDIYAFSRFIYMRSLCLSCVISIFRTISQVFSVILDVYIFCLTLIASLLRNNTAL